MSPQVIIARRAWTLDNELQPDPVLLIDPACGGQARISEDDSLEDAPELVAREEPYQDQAES